MKPSKRMGRPPTLAPPIARLVKKAGGIPHLLPLLGIKSPSTLRRWSDTLKKGLKLSPAITTQLEAAKAALKGKK